MGFFTAWAGKFSLGAVYKVVKGFFDSWFEDRRIGKAQKKLEENAAYKIENEHFDEYKRIIKEAKKIENRQRLRDIRSVFERLRKRKGNSDQHNSK